jgi:hypothetical protein
MVAKARSFALKSLWMHAAAHHNWKIDATKGFEQGISSLRSSFLVVPIVVDFKHRNPKLFRVMCAHHLLQHVNDLAERWLRSTLP